jgi:hypothetical protein
MKTNGRRRRDGWWFERLFTELIRLLPLGDLPPLLTFLIVIVVVLTTFSLALVFFVRSQLSVLQSLIVFFALLAFCVFVAWLAVRDNQK